MSAEGWIFIVGFRVFDVGLLVAWLVWYFRLRDDGGAEPPDDEGRDDEGGGPPLEPGDPSGGGGLGLLVPGSLRSERRLRDHGAGRRRTRRRGGEPLRQPTPARVRRPARRRSPVG